MSNLVPVTDMQVMADSIVKSNFYGFKTKEQVMAVMLVAQAENKHPATVVQEYDIIQGKPALKSQAILARFQLSGGKVEWHEVSPTKCSGTFSHPAGGSLKVEWTIQMAKQAQLVREGSGWTKYPEDMLRARVISRAVRSVYPACILGHYSVEEVSDFDPPKTKNMGLAEVVIPDPVPTLPELITDAPSGLYDLCLPDGTIYSSHDSQQEWVDAYIEMVAKIKGSSKFSDEAKKEKVNAFRDANKHTRHELDTAQQVRLAQETRGVVEEIKHPKELMSQTESELNENEF